MTTANEIKDIAQTRKNRYARRDERGAKVRRILTGSYDTSFKGLVQEGEEPVVPNIIYSAWRSFTHQIGQMPKLFGVSRLDSPTAQSRAEKHEQRIKSRLEAMRFRSLMPQAASWFVAHGLQPFTLTFDPALGSSRVMARDPLTCYPDTVWPNKAHLEDCIFISKYKPSQAIALFPEIGGLLSRYDDEPREVEITELVLPQVTIVAMTEPESYILREFKNPFGITPVWVARDISPDLDFHGQFDQLVPILVAQARLMALAVSYAEQQVAAETVIVGEVTSNQGRWATGPGAVNQIQPQQGASVQKLNNNMSPQVFQEIDRFERAMRISGPFPSSLSGESSTTWATGRGIEKLSESVDFEVSSKQEILAATLGEVFNAIPDFERAYGIIDPHFSKDVYVVPTFAFGASPVNAVRLMQLNQTGLMSTQTTRNQLPEIEDAQAEEQQVTIERLREALVANLQGQAGQGQADPDLLLSLIKDIREKKTPIEEAYATFQKAQQEQMASLLGGAPAEGGEAGAKPSFRTMLGLTGEGRNMSGTFASVPGRGQ